MAGSPALPRQQGISRAADQSLPGDRDGPGPSSSSVPEVPCLGNLRHVAPYFVERALPVGRLAAGRTVGKALGIGGGGEKKERSFPGSIVKNAALRDWWQAELSGGRLWLPEETRAPAAKMAARKGPPSFPQQPMRIQHRHVNRGSRRPPATSSEPARS
ncbi:unnamed protein product [Pseudo-nitzschia multistriata]|uniref:Uncharacterized protein n=1 Tax=Pseudo-nitzschia multistriata TaxID=183589 RepID=A0A448Z6E7_9STRA|nr:unnamed protein product [Pseudo-nitzschia multistriata]